MMKLYYKEKSPRALNDILLGDDYLKENWKLIPRICSMLNQILHWSQLSDDVPSITCRWFKERIGYNYATIIATIESLGLIKVDRTCRRRFKLGRFDSGKCFSYSLTDACCTALADHNKQYLYQLLTDKKAKRLNQQRISARGYHHKQYGDVRDELKRTIDGIQFDATKVQAVAETFTPAKRAFVYSLLIDVVKKDYSDLKHNKADNRVWNPYTQLPPEIKSLITIEGLQYIVTADIRSCYPSFFASYIQRLFPNDTSLTSEVEKWNGIFLNPSQDPKAHLANLLNATSASIKETMISYFNSRGFKRGVFVGRGVFKQFNAWLSKEFPRLYKLWLKTDIKQTGNNIGKWFETRLMLDQSIFTKARELGLVVGYEYDGFSIYGKVDAEHESVSALFAFIEARSAELLGLQVVFVSKDNTLDIAQMAMDQHEQSLVAVHQAWLKVCRRTFRKDATPVWDDFKRSQQEYHDGLSYHFNRIRTLSTNDFASRQTGEGTCPSLINKTRLSEREQRKNKNYELHFHRKNYEVMAKPQRYVYVIDQKR